MLLILLVVFEYMAEVLPSNTIDVMETPASYPNVPDMLKVPLE